MTSDRKWWCWGFNICWKWSQWWKMDDISGGDDSYAVFLRRARERPTTLGPSVRPTRWTNSLWTPESRRTWRSSSLTSSPRLRRCHKSWYVLSEQRVSLSHWSLVHLLCFCFLRNTRWRRCLEASSPIMWFLWWVSGFGIKNKILFCYSLIFLAYHCVVEFVMVRWVMYHSHKKIIKIVLSPLIGQGKATTFF